MLQIEVLPCLVLVDEILGALLSAKDMVGVTEDKVLIPD